jgi:hypothetical protein
MKRRFIFGRFEWKLQDLYIGCYWKKQNYLLDLWIVLIPTITLHLRWGRSLPYPSDGSPYPSDGC